MIATIKIKKEFNLKTIYAYARVRYWEDGMVNGQEDTNGDLIPCRQGDLWCPIIDIDTGVITNWTQGVKANVHYKVCDAGKYEIKDESGETVLTIDRGYVPAMMYPKENGYGDYIIMEIDEDGQIQNWRTTLNDFIDED
jgi:hypothetical protein